MKFRLVTALALFIASCATLLAQDATGTWQGTLKTPARDVRVVFKIARNPATEALQGQMFAVDQGGQALPISSVKQTGPSIEMKIDAIGGSFQGALSADGNTINGNFTQGPTPLPLALTKATPQTAWAIPEPPPPPKAMDPAANPGIEVATVKPSPAAAQGRLYTMRGTQLMAINVSLINLITFAYDLHERQVSNGPSWMDGEKFEITAKPDVPGQPNLAQMKKLFQAVLADRFGMKYHMEKKELSVYAITLPAGSKPKLTKSESTGNLPNLIFPRLGLLPARNATMTDLAQSLTGAVMDRPVVNQTGIEGRFDFTLDWTADEFQFASFGPRPAQAQTQDNGKPDIYKAFQEQLGLKLESTKAPADVLVIDKVTKPTEN